MSVLDRQMSATAKIFPHPLNAWYVAAWDHEVTNKKPLARTIAKRPLALYRTADGRPVALADACWHRLAPLSMGKLIGKDEIQCPYHGLRYNAAGRCTAMPAQETINPSAMVPSFPVVERYRYVWVWLGDMTLADPDLIPDMHQMDSPEWAGDGLTICGPVQLPAGAGQSDGPHPRGIRARLQHRPGRAERIRIHRHPRRRHRHRDPVDARRAAAAVLAEEHARQFPGFTGNVDRWQIINYQAPSTICIDVGVAKAGTGAPEGDRSQGVNGFVMNTITPETDRTSHYFWAFMRNYRLDSQLITTQLRQGVESVFGEDEAMLTAQQQAIDANPDYEFYSLNVDAGGMWVRRILDRMLVAENRLDSSGAVGVGHRCRRRLRRRHAGAAARGEG